jgi:hypothetical protein
VLMPRLRTDVTGARPFPLHLGREPSDGQPRPSRWRGRTRGPAGRWMALLTAGAVLISLAFTAGAQAAEPQANAFLLSFGSPGAGTGEFGSYGPIGVAVDPASGDVYVTDYINGRVERFASSGNYLS